MWTDVPALDRTIELFLPVASAKRWHEPNYAVGACWSAAIQYRDLLEEYDFDPEYLEGTPDALGYTDRPFAGHYAFHAVNLAREGCDYFLIDWTAAQYGYKLFPLVRQLDWDQYLELRDRCASLTPPYDYQPAF